MSKNIKCNKQHKECRIPNNIISKFKLVSNSSSLKIPLSTLPLTNLVFLNK